MQAWSTWCWSYLLYIWIFVISWPVGADGSDEIDLSVAQVATGQSSTCYARFGKCACWGRNLNGQLGAGISSDENIGDDPTPTDNFVLSAIDLGEEFVVQQIVGAGERHCAVSTQGKLKVYLLHTYTPICVVLCVQSVLGLELKWYDLETLEYVTWKH